MASFGMPLDEWQEVALEAAMGERSNGKWASKFVGISAPRQNGKSQLIVARALAGVMLFGEKMIIISAHETDTARRVWKRLTDLIEDNPSLDARVTGRMNAVNREYLQFGHGLEKQTIMLKARSQTGSRGFSADCLLLDEGQILGKRAWGALLPTLAARASVTVGGPQVWLFGTPPTQDDDPHAFGKIRESATAGKARHCWLEWAAEPDDDIDDPATWAKANPSYGVRILHDELADDRANMDDDQFRAEHLGMWSSVETGGVIPAPSWEAAGDPTSVAVDRFALGVEVGPDLAWASVCLAGQRGDSEWHVMLAEDQHTKGKGTAWLEPWVAAFVKANPQVRTVKVDVGGPIKALLTQRGSRWYLGDVIVDPVKVSELGAGCSRFLDGVVTGWLHHTGQPQFTAGVLPAGKRALGDTGTWVWSRKSATSDITPVQAGTLALIGAQDEKPKKPASRSNEKRRVVVYS